jgi:hypothetical protein
MKNPFSYDWLDMKVVVRRVGEDFVILFRKISMTFQTEQIL